MRKEMLAGGHIVTELIKDFMENKNEYNFKTVMSCLRDSDVYISARMVFSEEDQTRFAEAKPGEKISPKDKVKLNPGLLKTKDGKIYFPVFTMEEKIPEDQKKNAPGIKIPFTECIKMVLNVPTTEAMVVNPFSENLLLNKQNLQIIANLPPSED